jgi:hypothetical protein
MAVQMLKRMDGGIHKQWVEPEDLTKRRNEGWVTNPEDIKLEPTQEIVYGVVSVGDGKVDVAVKDDDLDKLREMAKAIDYSWHKTAGKPKLIKVLKEYYEQED